VSVIAGREIPCSAVTYVLAITEWKREGYPPPYEVDGHLTWVPVRRMTPAGRERVFNLTVDVDETFVADGLAVHNCAMFTSLAITKGGAPMSARTASVAEVRRQAEQGGGGYQRGFIRASQARPGDLILFGNDHIGMVDRVENGRIRYVGGNQSDGVTMASVPVGRGDIVRPLYGARSRR